MRAIRKMPPIDAVDYVTSCCLHYYKDNPNRSTIEVHLVIPFYKIYPGKG